jgi:hypothetical protein
MGLLNYLDPDLEPYSLHSHTLQAWKMEMGSNSLREAEAGLIYFNLL